MITSWARRGLDELYCPRAFGQRERTAMTWRVSVAGGGPVAWQNLPVCGEGESSAKDGSGGFSARMHVSGKGWFGSCRRLYLLSAA
ncbi:unnamed protein product [Urochloa humidicola]